MFWWMAFPSVAVLHFQISQKVPALVLSQAIAPTEYPSKFCWHLGPSPSCRCSQASCFFPCTWIRKPSLVLHAQLHTDQRSSALASVVVSNAFSLLRPLVEARRLHAWSSEESLWLCDWVLGIWILDWKLWMVRLLAVPTTSVQQQDVGFSNAVSFALKWGCPLAEHG